MRKTLLLLFATLLLATFALAAPKMETVGACSESGVPDAVKKALASQGYKVTFDDGFVVTVWPAAQIAAAEKGRQDTAYSISPSQFLGVMKFDKATKDYRGDTIQAGVYNLRYEIQPSDGDHLGTSPTPDFLLLVPPAADADPAAKFTFDQLVGFSRQVTGKKHPAPMNLAPAESAKQFPSVFNDSEEHTILAFKVKAGSTDVAIALVVRGTTTE